MTTSQLTFAIGDLALAPLLYAITVTVVAITAIATTSSEQRRAALTVLELLLRKSNEPDAGSGVGDHGDRDRSVGDVAEAEGEQ